MNKSKYQRAAELLTLKQLYGRLGVLRLAPAPNVTPKRKPR